MTDRNDHDEAKAKFLKKRLDAHIESLLPSFPPVFGALEKRREGFKIGELTSLMMLGPINRSGKSNLLTQIRILKVRAKK